MMMALLTIGALSTGASAQSIAPNLQARGPGPELPIAPSLAVPTPIATAEVDRASLGVPAADVKPVEALGSASPGHALPGAASTPGDEKLQSVRRARPETARVEPRRAVEGNAYKPIERARPVVRDFGRFTPPVF